MKGIKCNAMLVPKDEAHGISVHMWEEAGPFTEKMANRIKKKHPGTLRNISSLNADQSKPFIKIFWGGDDT